jgi:hypothetical protein
MVLIPCYIRSHFRSKVQGSRAQTQECRILGLQCIGLMGFGRLVDTLRAYELSGCIHGYSVGAPPQIFGCRNFYEMAGGGGVNSNFSFHHLEHRPFLNQINRPTKHRLKITKS